MIVPWTLFFLAASATATFAVLWSQEVKEDDRAKDVQVVASKFVLALTNFSADSIDEDVEAIRSFAVGSFADEVDTFFGPEAIEAIEQASAESTGEIQALFVQDQDSEQASVFAVVQETVTNSVLNDPQTDILRLEVGLIKTPEGWKVDRVDIFQAPGGGLAPPLP